MNPNDDFNHYESIYWVFTQFCNDSCAHCYNLSGPQGEKISLADCLAIVANLPDHLGRLILSGGEPLVERDKLYAILDALQERYRGTTQIMLQTNGDLLDGAILDQLLARGVSRIDIASIDRFHRHQGERQAELETLFRSRGMAGDDTDPLIDKEHFLKPGAASYGFWGATESMWLGGNWARGRAMATDVWLRDPKHNFCAILSGARGFLGGTDLPQECSIQLWKINPCCPGTRYPLGDARREKVSEVLARAAKSKFMHKLNEGDPLYIGETLGITAAYAQSRAEHHQNICLWCDEFFEHNLDPQNPTKPLASEARQKA
ncbi:MAG: radical SAM protein [Gammaproteobacteria bacterium HGW-Gammaproteobacteria-3]|nr:MAG: radical SAM protein [Gammaproteobacteria bacterium HGW-Gammaproteobacteria-3]